MTTSILVVTPHNSFGSMLRSSLEETGHYRVYTAADEPTALLQLKTQQCALAFLDLDLGLEAAIEIGGSLRALKADLGLTIVTDEATPPALDALRPWSLLRKPFYMPELLERLGPIADAKQKSAPPTSSRSPDGKVAAQTVEDDPTDMVWLEDVNKAAQRLTRLTLESSAQAALITRDKQLWAYAGGLSQETAGEVVRLITRNWDEQNSGDLLRFARLETTRAEHMLYASPLSVGTLLALVFDAETPFSTIRTQANSLARSLSIEKTGPLASFKPDAAQQVRTSRPPLPLHEDVGPELPSIMGIISDIPSPKPPRQPAFQPVSLESTPLEMQPASPVVMGSIVSRESSPAIRLGDLLLGELDETVKHQAQELDVTAPSRPQRPPTPVRAPQLGELDETRPHSITEVAGRVILEPASAGLYQLNYACLLVPRFSSHYLTGDIADRLGTWLPNICVAFAWRLEFQAVRPEYMQWVVSVPPNTSPGYLMRIMRQQTSEKIFAEIPRLKKENPSGDFWAPGYLIMGGTQPHPGQLVKDYIKQTRERQGQTKPRK